MYRYDTFLHSNIHMVWGLLPGPIHGICHKQTLTCMGLTYTLSMTNLVGACRRSKNLLTKFCYGLVALSLSPKGCWSHLSASATYSSGSMSSLVFPLMPTSKQWPSLVVHYKYIKFQYFYRSCNILCMQYISPCSSSINLGNVVKISKIGFNENFPFNSLIFSWNSFSTQQLVDFIVLAAPGHATVQIFPFDSIGHH